MYLYRRFVGLSETPKSCEYEAGFCDDLDACYDTTRNAVHDDSSQLDDTGEYQENWRRQNLDLTAIPKTKRCRNTILEPIKSSKKLRVFPNANLCDQKKTNNPVLTHNTCSFDAIFQLYAACYMDSQQFKEFADKCETSEFMDLLRRFCNWEKMDSLIIARQKLLHEAFDEKVQINRKILELDC